MNLRDAKAPQIREQLFDNCDLHAAVEFATRTANGVNDALNWLADDGTLNVASQCVCRALAAKAIIDVCAQWLSDVGYPLPECFAALKSIMDNPPPEIDGFVTNAQGERV